MKKLLLLIFFLSSFCLASDLDTKISQMIIIGFNGDNVKSRGFKRVYKQVQTNEIGGVILFSKNIKSIDSLIEMNEKLLSANKITPFISIDNEGGLVQRYDFIEHKSARDVAQLSQKEAHLEYAKMANFERELKINLNFAPCVDLEINKDSIISKKKRSYGDDYKEVSKYAAIFINEHNQRKIATSIKHFPGHGSVKGDTHKGFVDATKTFTKEEIKPYSDLKNYDKLNMVMVSHIFNSNFDEKYPASLSKKTIDMLKNSVGFKGVIISDDYDMGAIRDNYSLRDIVVNSINAGVDILLFSNNIKIKDDKVALKIHKIIKEEIKLGNIKEDRIDEAYKKVLKLKREF